MQKYRLTFTTTREALGIKFIVEIHAANERVAVFLASKFNPELLQDGWDLKSVELQPDDQPAESPKPEPEQPIELRAGDVWENDSVRLVLIHNWENDWFLAGNNYKENENPDFKLWNEHFQADSDLQKYLKGYNYRRIGHLSTQLIKD